VSNTADVQEVTNYLRAFRFVQDNLRDPVGRPMSRLLCDAHRLLLHGARGAGKHRRIAALAKLDRRHPTG